ncbi:phage major capsid protein [Shimia thalassica]|uniref:phage major capsid protein n=1 Tax=Shimia thalassica TaxID=1715693 RepID=UPI0026E42C17|nr:phage major capsid protein [Shimia thalassica]MDO6799368.1 phage major capsid protein [Shimia thalassica]
MSKLMMPAIAMAALAAARPVAVIGGPRADGDDPEVLLKKVSQQLETLNSDTKKVAENALSESKKAGEVSAETKAAADKLLTQQDAMNKVVEGLKNTLEGLDGKVLEVSQQVAAGGGRRGSDAPQSLGAAFVAHEDEIKAFLNNGATGVLNIQIQNAITTADGSGGGLIYHDEERTPINMPKRQLRVRDLVSVGRTSSNLVPYRRQTVRSGASAAIAEGGTYPESSFGWEKTDAKVKKIGAVTNITEETMADADLLQTEIDTELRYDLDLEEERQLLAGDGVGENQSGLITNAPAFVAAGGLPNQTRIDRLRLAILQVVLADYIPTAMLLNPLDWAAIDLLKDAQLRFIFGNPGAQTTPMLWGKDVVESNTMTDGEWLVGDLKRAATIYDRSDVEVLISSEHDTNFVEDMLTMKARKRLAFANRRPAATVSGDFTFA